MFVLLFLGFDLIEVGENEVILGVGKHVNLRMLQLALQAGLALFGQFVLQKKYKMAL